MNDAEHSGSFARTREPQLLDGGVLLAWLDVHAVEMRGSRVVPSAIYEGLATRVRRGDFNTEVDR